MCFRRKDRHRVVPQKWCATTNVDQHSYFVYYGYNFILGRYWHPPGRSAITRSYSTPGPISLAPVPEPLTNCAAQSRSHRVLQFMHSTPQGYYQYFDEILLEYVLNKFVLFCILMFRCGDRTGTILRPGEGAEGRHDTVHGRMQVRLQLEV